MLLLHSESPAVHNSLARVQLSQFLSITSDSTGQAKYEMENFTWKMFTLLLIH